MRRDFVSQYRYVSLGQMTVLRVTVQRIGCNMIFAITDLEALAFMVISGQVSDFGIHGIHERMLSTEGASLV